MSIRRIKRETKFVGRDFPMKLTITDDDGTSIVVICDENKFRSIFESYIQLNQSTDVIITRSISFETNKSIASFF